MHATIIGGGRIGRGFVASLLERNNVSKTFLDVSDDLVKEFNKEEEYTVHILGNETNNTIIENFEAFNFRDKKALKTEINNADFIFTAVGGKNLRTIGSEIGRQYKNLLREEIVSSFIIVTCENWLTPAADLLSSIVEELNESEKEVFLKNVDVTQGVIRASGTSAPKGEETSNLLDTWMQDYWTLPIDKSRINNHFVPNWKHFEFNENFGEMLAQKIYTNNTSVALVGYLGYLKGHKYVADSANDDEIEPIFKKCFQEIHQALVHTLGVSTESQKEFAEVAEDKYKDYKIVDDVKRIARDPIRKLSPDDRFIGPAIMAQKAGTKPEAISLGAAAALYFDNPEDSEAVELQKLRKEKGIDYVLDNICGLQNNQELKDMILSSIEVLKAKGWIPEGEMND